MQVAAKEGIVTRRMGTKTSGAWSIITLGKPPSNTLSGYKFPPVLAPRRQKGPARVRRAFLFLIQLLTE